MAEQAASAEWSKAAVLERLETAATDTDVVAQIFLQDSVPIERMRDTADQLVAGAAGAGHTTPVIVGPYHKRARSFSIKAEPAVIRALAGSSLVKSILPATLDEGMLIAPVGRSAVR